MKVLIVSVVILALIATGTFFYYSSLCTTAEDMLDSVKKIQESASLDNWDKVYPEINSLMDKWDKYSRNLAQLVDHDELDSIMLRLATIREYANYKEKPELMAELSALSDLLSHIPRKESLLIENIL